MKKGLTKRQQQVLDFIHETHVRQGFPPSFREIAKHFGFRSVNAASDHVKMLQSKGVLSAQPGRARALRVIGKRTPRLQNLVSVPVFGTIPAGFPAEEAQENEGCLLVDVNATGVKPTARTFGLKVRGESMIGKHIMEGDLAIIEHGVEPRNGDVVAALIDGQVTLKTFVIQRGKPFLKAENPKYPNLIPQQELQIQGVMVALIRKSR